MPQPTPQQLKAELLDEQSPLFSQYAPLVAAADWEGLAALLNARTYRGPVPIIDLSAYCTVNGITGAVEHAANASASDDVRKLCYGVMSILRDDWRLNVADLDNPAADYMLDGLIAHGLLTSQQKTEILALGDGRYNRVEVVWGNREAPGLSVSARDVRAAWRGN